jgi:hypothetical protein
VTSNADFYHNLTDYRFGWYLLIQTTEQSHNQKGHSERNSTASNLIVLLDLFFLCPVVGAPHEGKSKAHSDSIRQEVQSYIVAAPGEGFDVEPVDRQEVEWIDKSEHTAIEEPGHQVALEITTGIPVTIHTDL